MEQYARSTITGWMGVAILSGCVLVWSWAQGWYFNPKPVPDNSRSPVNYPPPARLLSTALLNKAAPDSSFYRHDSTCTGFHHRHFDPALPAISPGTLTQKTLKAATGLEWTPLTPIQNRVDFTQHVENTQNRVIYLLEQRWIGQAGPRLLSAGSDDGLAVWVNGELAGTHHAGRALEAGSDWFPVHLRRGYNTFLFKVDQGHGSWGLTWQLRSSNELQKYVTDNVTEIYRDLPEAAIVPDSTSLLALKQEPRRQVDSLHRISWRWLPQQINETPGRWHERAAWQLDSSIPLPDNFHVGRWHYRILGNEDSTLYEEILPVYRRSAAREQLHQLEKTKPEFSGDPSQRVRREAARTYFSADYSTRMQARALWEASIPEQPESHHHEMYGIEDPDGKIWPYRLFRPVSMQTDHSYPLVFVFHTEFDQTVDSFWKTYAGGSHARTARWRTLAEKHNIILAHPFIRGHEEGITRAISYLPRMEQKIRRSLSAPVGSTGAVAWSKSVLSLFELMEEQTFSTLNHIGLISPWLAENALERRRIITQLTRTYPEMNVFIRYGLDDTDVPVYLPRRWKQAMATLSGDRWQINYREIPGATHWNYPGDPEAGFYRWITTQSQPQKDMP